MANQHIEAVVEKLNRQDIVKQMLFAFILTSIVLVSLQLLLLDQFYLGATLFTLGVISCLTYVIARKNEEKIGELLSARSANNLFDYFFSHKPKQAIQCQKEYREMLRFRDEAESIFTKSQFFDKRFDYVADLDFAKIYPFTAFICLYVDKENIPFDELIKLDRKV